MLSQHDLNNKDRITYFGVTDFRGNEEKFGIKADDRTRHMYVIGKTGMGKSTLLENMAIQDIRNGEGLCFVDPHGTTAEKLLKFVPEERINDVVYFAPFDTKYPMSLNILEHVGEDERHLVASGLMDSFKKVFGEDVFSGRMVYLLNNAILSLLENEGESLMGINRIFADKDYRKKIVSNVKDPALMSFWRDEFAKYEDKYVKEATAAIQNKIGQFIMTPMVRNIVGQAKSSFNLREIMDNRKILICNLSIGQTGSENLNLLGSLLVTKIYLAAMSRANLSYENLQKAPPFYFYVDEFQNFVNDSFAQILSQSRKYNLGLIVANQYVEEQLTDKVRAAIFGNVGTFICFRIGAPDAEQIEKEFAPNFTAEDLVNLGARQIYLRLSIDGVGSKPFSARTMAPIQEEGESFVPAILACSRMAYAKEKKIVEDEIMKWYEPVTIVKSTSSLSTVKADESTSSAPFKMEYRDDEIKSRPRSASERLELKRSTPSTANSQPKNPSNENNRDRERGRDRDVDRSRDRYGEREREPTRDRMGSQPRKVEYNNEESRERSTYESLSNKSEAVSVNIEDVKNKVEDNNSKNDFSRKITSSSEGKNDLVRESGALVNRSEKSENRSLRDALNLAMKTPPLKEKVLIEKDKVNDAKMISQKQNEAEINIAKKSDNKENNDIPIDAQANKNTDTIKSSQVITHDDLAKIMGLEE